MSSRAVVIAFGFVVAALAVAFLCKSDDFGPIDATDDTFERRDGPSSVGPSPTTAGDRREVIEVTPAAVTVTKPMGNVAFVVRPRPVK